MQNSPSLEQQIAYAGVKYGRRHDILYRIGLILQVLGTGLLAVLYPLEEPFYTIGIMIFELGTLIAGIFLLTWIPLLKKLVLGSILAGMVLQIAGFYVPEQHAVTMLITGIGLVCAGAVGIARKESYRYGYPEGRILVWVYPLVLLLNLFGISNNIINTLLFSAIFLLNLFLIGKRLKQPLIATSIKNSTDNL